MADESRPTEDLQTVIVQPDSLSLADFRLEDKISGALLGGAIADAMGWPTEFIKSETHLRDRFGLSRLDNFVAWEKQTGGRFNAYVEYVAPGEYSDDTQLTLCTARSVLPDGRCDIEYFSKVELPLWLGYARGAGATITASAKALSRKTTVWNRNFFNLRRGNNLFTYVSAGGNGAAMRIAALAMANPNDVRQLQQEVWRNSVVTHGHPRALVGALVYARAVAYILATGSPQMTDFLECLRSFIDSIRFPDDDPDMVAWKVEWNRHAEEDFESSLATTCDEMRHYIEMLAPTNKSKLYELYHRFGCFSPATKGSGTATVAAALAVFVRFGRNFEHAVLEAINTLGTDTDTIGAMAATLAGAHAGYSAIPEKWATQMQDFGYFVRVAASLSRIAERRAIGLELRHEAHQGQPAVPDMTTLGTDISLGRGQRVKHPVFGLGSVTNVDVQPLRRRKGGKMLFVLVSFDCGQSCKFKFFTPGPTDSYTVQRKPGTRKPPVNQPRLFR